jgi:hypothetical protein
MRFKNAGRPLPEIGRELGVDAVVEGSVLRAGESVRITAQLIDARSDHHLWSESYERDLRDVLRLQSEVAQAIAQEVRLSLRPTDRARLSARRPVDPAGYQAFLKGRHLLQSLTPADHRTSLRYLEQAVREDPEYAPAWAELARNYT